ncbi:unnamed protein product [Ectocarpus sp. 12 AP-2014]
MYHRWKIIGILACAEPLFNRKRHLAQIVAIRESRTTHKPRRQSIEDTLESDIRYTLGIIRRGIHNRFPPYQPKERHVQGYILRKNRFGDPLRRTLCRPF